MNIQRVVIYILVSLIAINPNMSMGNEYPHKTRILKNAIESEKVSVYLFDGVKNKCDKIISHPPFKEGAAEFKFWNGKSRGYVRSDGEIAVPWQITDVSYDSGQGARVLRQCNAPTRGKRYTRVSDVQTTEDGFPYAWQLSTTSEFCAKTAYYTNCRSECLQRVPSGSLAYALILTRDIAEQITGLSCN